MQKRLRPGCSSSRGQPRHSHFCFLALSVMPAVPGLRHQQRDEVTLLEAQEGAVISGSVRENGLHPRPAVPLEPCGHGAGAWQRLVFGWWETEANECPESFTPRPNPSTSRDKVPNLAYFTPGTNKTFSVRLPSSLLMSRIPGRICHSWHRPPAMAKGAASLHEIPQHFPPGNAVRWLKPTRKAHGRSSSACFLTPDPEARAALDAGGTLPVTALPPPASPVTVLTVAATPPAQPAPRHPGSSHSRGGGGRSLT